MNSMHKLADFQRAAVDHIVARLRDKQGSRRFLLADEVGLGKTIVARGVIDALAQRRRTPLKVVYLCSNSEIAQQNRHKLVDSGGHSVTRASELVLIRRETVLPVDMYAFTPGTSLRGGTGAGWERRLMLYLLNRVCGIDVSNRRVREYFRCGAGEARWTPSTKWAALRADFAYQTQGAFQSALADALRAATFGEQSLVDAITLDAEAFSSATPELRKRRNRLVGAYRAIIQRVALRALQPDLVVLDEVQRFKEVIDNAADETTIGYELFRARAPVLILSATPYRLFTAEHEVRLSGTSHHDDFYATLGFLFAGDQRAPSRIRQSLESFGQRLQQISLDRSRDVELLSLKRKIESDLRQVICRTERNWYFLDSRRGVAERGVRHTELPGRAELREFMDIHQGLAEHLDGVGLVTDFWKSAPSVLTFMDAGYALTKKLRDKNVRVPRTLIERANHADLPARNLRVRRLVEHTLGGESRRPFLWTRPTYSYQEDVVYGDQPPRKMLVFSGWRFVPKAVAVLVSDAAATRLGMRGGERKQPLRFTTKGSLHVFDSCMPSWALSEIVGLEVFAPRDDGGLPKARDVLLRSLARLKAHFEVLGIRISPTRAANPWRCVALLDRSSTAPKGLSGALLRWSQGSDVSEAERKAIGDFRRWLDSGEPGLAISRADLHRLALVSIASPAVCLLRALRSAYGDESVLESMELMVGLCLGELRSYFNRPLVQQIVRRHAPTFRWERKRSGANRTFSEGLLGYALDHHFQAVVDEHSYLLRHASARLTASSAVEHFKSVWSLGRGARRTNRARGRGDRVLIGADTKSWPTHFALAFGEDTAADVSPTDEADRRMRRSDVREAFNSPFWPFVLATTSVGQEGLDFHLHCRDVFHWNLPSNPVDLEQREGRINRRDCLAVRQSIARDLSLPSAMRYRNGSGGNLWSAVFAHLERDAHGGRQKHGLHPHWIYECRDRERTVPIERHVAFFAASRDSRRYERLKSGLALYRLVFGQVNQEHLLSDLEERLAGIPSEQREAAKHHLSGYMLNLSPIDSAVALRFANDEAIELLSRADGAGVRQLLQDVEHVIENHASELAPAIDVVHGLQIELARALDQGALGTRRIRKVATALAYLRNPYDQYFDGQSVGGFDDDIEVLKRTMRKA